MEWEVPAVRTLLTALASFGRVILHDHRGIGLSSRNVDVPGRHVQRIPCVARLS
jgi:hypothetical protein